MTTKDRQALVTGANRGIGQEVARVLARDGWKVLVAARDAKKGEAAAARLKKETGGKVRAVTLDVMTQESIAAAARRLKDGAIRLDALVNNAGIYGEARSGRDARRMLETNFFGPLRVTEAFKDLLNPGARIVNVTSGLGSLSNFSPERQKQLSDPALTRDGLVALVEDFLGGGKGWGDDSYNVSKAALNALTRIHAADLKDRGIKVNATCPGWVRTDMGGRNAPRSVEEGAASVLWAVTLPDDAPTGGIFRDGHPVPP